MVEHAVVTGGSSGIGAAVVRGLTARGLAVTVLDQQPGTAPPGATVHERLVDVTDEDAVGAALEDTARLSGRATRLVTCHGIRGEFRPADELDLATTRRVFEVHVIGTLVVARRFAALLEESAAESTVDAAIVTVASTTAYRGWAKQADYGVAKAAVRQLTENLAVEWADRGIRVNAVAPGHTMTPMVADMVNRGYDTAATAARTPLGRLAEPDEQAAAIEFLLLDAGFVTGVCLPVDGGWTVVGK